MRILSAWRNAKTHKAASVLEITLVKQRSTQAEMFVWMSRIRRVPGASIAGSNPAALTIFPPRSAGFVEGPVLRTSRESDGILESGHGGNVTHRACVTAGRVPANMGYWCNGSTRVTAKTMEAAVKRERVRFPHTPLFSHPQHGVQGDPATGFPDGSH